MAEIRINVRAFTVVSLLLAVMASAIGVVNAKHQARIHFVQLQELQKLRDTMQVNWGRLQLEQAAWSTHGRVEKTANERLGMIMPSKKSIEIIRP